MPDQKNARELLEHQLGTYNDLRVVLTWIAIALPFVVPGVGWIQCALPSPFIDGSLSAYYHHLARFEFLTSRDLFVGGLISAAACLYAYKGFSKRENSALNAAAVFAIIVAFTPTAHGAKASVATALQNCVVSIGADYQESPYRKQIHAGAAVAFFLCLAYVSIRRSRDTLRLLPETKRESYNRRYVLAGVLMGTSPIAAILVSQIFTGSPAIVIYVIEALGVWAFSYYWRTKTREMKETHLDELIAKEAVKRVQVAPDIPKSALDRSIRKIQVPRDGYVERVVRLGDTSVNESMSGR